MEDSIRLTENRAESQNMEDNIPELKKKTKQTKLIDLRRSLFPVNNLKANVKAQA